MGQSNRIDAPFRLSERASDVELLAKYFRGLGDPIRLQVLALLRAGERSVGELVEALAQPQPKVSNHLACLRWCGFVVGERRGKRVYYRLADDSLTQVIDLTSAMAAEHEAHAAAWKVAARPAAPAAPPPLVS